MSYTIAEANLSDAGEILALQKRAYLSEAALVNDASIEPLVQTLEGKQEEFRTRLFLKFSIGQRIIGSVKGFREGDTCYIGKFIFDQIFMK